MFFGKEGYERISGGTRALEMAADSWEAARVRRLLAAASLAKPFSLPWGRGPKIRKTEVGRSRRSGTVRRRRSGGSPAAGKTRYGGFSVKYSRTHHLLRIADPWALSVPLP
jgi:hypothetical protein